MPKLSEEKSKILRWLGYKHWIPKKILVPIVYDKYMALLYECVFMNACDYTRFISLMFGFSTSIFFKMYDKYEMKSVMDFLKFQRWIFKNLKFLLILSQRCDKINKEMIKLKVKQNVSRTHRSNQERTKKHKKD